MQWLVILAGCAGAGLILFNAVSLQHRRADLIGPNPWAWAIISSRVILVLPFLALAVTRGRWPGALLLAIWFAVSGIAMLVADTLDRFALLKRIRSRQSPPLTQ